MVESLKELNEKCQKSDYKTVGNWMVRKILRPAALPVTWLLLHTSVTAHQVTLAALLVGLFGNFLLAIPGSGFFFAGVLLLQFWYLLDHVDGQIARYRKTSGLTGRFFDYLMHHLIHATLFFALGWHAYEATGRTFFIFWGFVTSFAMLTFNFLYDVRYKTFIERLGNGKSFQSVQAISEKTEASRPVSVSPLARVFSFLHKLIEMHVTMNILTVASLLELFIWKTASLRILLFFFYGLVILPMAILKASAWIMTGKIDSEFDRYFKEII